jgi:hypothetical protein
LESEHRVSWFEVRRDPLRLRVVKWIVAIVLALLVNWAYINGLPDAANYSALVSSEPENGQEISLELVDDLPEMQYVETNPDAVENEPDETPNISNRNQQAAQEDVAGADRNDTPYIEGEDAESAKILEGAMPTEGEDVPFVEAPMADGVDRPQPAQDASQATRQQRMNPTQQGQESDQQPSPEQLPTIDAPFDLMDLPAIPPPPPTPDFIERVEPQSEDGLEVPIIEAPEDPVEMYSNQPGEDRILNVNVPPSVAQQLSKAREAMEQQLQEQETQEQREAREAVRPQPMPRPRLSPKVLPGPMLDSRTYAVRMGAIAFDAKFSQFGHYLQRMFETIQLQWYSLLNDITIGQENRPAYVVIEYDLDKDGRVVATRVLETNAGDLGTLLCKDAIEARAPFGPWTRQMIDQLGEQQTIRLRFIYL